jgi:predicted acyl esterase
MATVTLDPVWIPLANGMRLCATIRMPADAGENPVPALLEYLPYRRRDGTVFRDAILHQFYAEHGYAAVRLDIRGTGDSDGLLRDEYTVEEQTDAVEAIAWLAAQPWCNGRVGMFGISWGGFNALQVAARRPPALKAIITLCSTDDRYRDECHYMGGALLTNSLGWGMMAFQYAAQPPDPAIVGERWRSMWQQRLDNLRLFAADWLEHQESDAYWQQGSVATDYAAIEAPVLAVGGWADGYSNAVPRLMENLACPRKAWIGPWAHAYPHLATPGPAIDYPTETLRWWDRWLKDADTGIDGDTTYRVFVEDAFRPARTALLRAGNWVGLEHWPVASSPVFERQSLTVPYRTDVGADFSEWCPYSGEDQLPGDQNSDDRKSEIVDCPILSADLLLIGAAKVSFEAMAQQGGVLVFRLNEVWPDGASTNISYGVLRLASGATSTWVPLNDVAHRFAAGNRLRLAISTGSWPLLWPAPPSAPIELRNLALHLPDAPTMVEAPQFLPARAAVQPEVTIESAVGARSVGNDAIDVLRTDTKLRVHQTSTTAHREAIERYELDPDNVHSARMLIRSTWTLQRNEWTTRTIAELELTATEADFHLTAEMTAFEGPEIRARRTFRHRIPRLV